MQQKLMALVEISSDTGEFEKEYRATATIFRKLKAEKTALLR